MGNFSGMTATDVLRTLYDLEIIKTISIQPILKPMHGSCYDCGWCLDECVCEDNKIIRAIKKLEKDKICCK